MGESGDRENHYHAPMAKPHTKHLLHLMWLVNQDLAQLTKHMGGVHTAVSSPGLAWLMRAVVHPGILHLQPPAPLTCSQVSGQHYPD